MKIAAGGTVPTQIHLPDSSMLYPDAAGQVLCPALFVVALMSAGWQIVGIGTTPVP